MKFILRIIWHTCFLITFLLFKASAFSNNYNNQQVAGAQRAIIIYNFAQQVTWPKTNNSSSFKIGVLGTDPTITNLKSLAKKRTIKGKTIEILQFNDIGSVKDIQLLYVNNKFNFNINQILTKIKRKNILLITEDYDYKSSMINIIRTDDYFQYEINERLLENGKFIHAPSLKKSAISSSEKWQSLYEKINESLKEVVIENEQQKEIIKTKDQEIEIVEEKITIKEGLIENLFLENELKEKKYEEKIELEKQLEQTIKGNAKLIASQKEKIDASNAEIERQQMYLNEQKKQVLEQQKVLKNQVEKISSQKKTNIILIGFLLFLLTSAALIYRGYLAKKELSKKLEEQNLEIHQQSIILESKNNELEQFAYIASHDLQEPLNTISSFIGLIEEDHGDSFNDVSKESLKYIIDASERMKKLIQSILEYSRLGRTKEYTLVDTEILITNIKADFKTIIEKTNTEIDIYNLPKVKGSKTELRLLLQNLISNAIKFNKPGVLPKIQIKCSEKRCPKNNSLGFWEFSVKDNGIGVPEKHQKRIFNIFQRLHSREEYKGTGIGLAHCKKIVESHGGDIWLKSKPNEGSTFYFTIPV